MIEAWHRPGIAAVTPGPERGGTFHPVKLLEFKDGKVIRDTRYFAEQFEAPEARAKWTKGEFPR